MENVNTNLPTKEELEKIINTAKELFDILSKVDYEIIRGNLYRKVGKPSHCDDDIYSNLNGLIDRHLSNAKRTEHYEIITTLTNITIKAKHTSCVCGLNNYNADEYDSDDDNDCDICHCYQMRLNSLYDLPSKIILDSKNIITWYHLNDMPHRENGPARITNTYEEYYIMSYLFRFDGPSQINYKDGKIKSSFHKIGSTTNKILSIYIGKMTERQSIKLDEQIAKIDELSAKVGELNKIIQAKSDVINAKDMIISELNERINKNIVLADSIKLIDQNGNDVPIVKCHHNCVAVAASKEIKPGEYNYYSDEYVQKLNAKILEQDQIIERETKARELVMKQIQIIRNNITNLEVNYS